MAKVIFFFGGTGDDGIHYASLKEKIPFKDDVIRIYIKGCQEKTVGNGILYPDLNIAANNIRSAFNTRADGTVSLNLTTLKTNFGDGLYNIYPSQDSEDQQIDSIALEGFSRGAVTTFATAKKLDDLGIPIDIIANQPVPGEASSTSKLVLKHNDLSHCENIRSATTILGNYNLENGVLHNVFFRQMIAKLPKDTKVSNFLIPHQAHLDWFRTYLASLHIEHQLAQHNYCRPNREKADIKRWYATHPDHYFTPPKFSQKIYGADDSIEKDPVYLEMVTEKAHKIIKSNQQLTSQQAEAIVSIADLRLPPDKNIALIRFVLKKTEQAATFINIVNKVSDSCAYLSGIVQKPSPKKSEAIRDQSKFYKAAVFTNSHEFLSKDTPGKQDKIDFAKSIYQAEREFRKEALGIERGTMRLVLKFLTNFISHITGVGLILNAINKARTGNWLLLNHNRSVGAIRDIRKRFVDELDATRKKTDDAEPVPPGSTLKS